jgi:hypothetical protein
MAIIVKKGPLGSMSGKIGNVVVSNWKDIAVGKQAPRKRKKKKKGEPLSDQSARLGAVTHFLSPFSDHIAIGFKKRSNKNPAFQTAVEYNLAHAVIGEYPDYKIDYKKVAFSKGSLDMAWGTKIELRSAYEFYVKWEVPETSSIRATGHEQAILMLYAEQKERLVVFGDKMFKRADLEINAKFSEFFHGQTLHAWIFFSSADGKANSRTRYIGSVRVPKKKKTASANI